VRKPTLLWRHLRDLNQMTCLPWLATAALLWILFRHRKEPLVRQVALPWTVLLLGFHAMLALFSFQQTRVPDLAWIRYELPIVPFAFGLVALVLWFVARSSRLLAGALFVVLVCTNALTLSPWTPQFRWLLPAYVLEVHRPFRTSYQAAVEFLKDNAPPNATVATVPGYCVYPVMFYLDDQVRFCCLLDAHTALPREAVRRLGAPLYREEHFPEWLILFGRPKSFLRQAEYYCRPHQVAGAWVAHSYVQVRDLNTFWFDTSRPELPWHSFSPRTTFNPDLESIYVLKRQPAEAVEAPASNP
jgi:hypothetical protein